MEIWSFIAEKIEAGVKVMLMYVIRSNGSSPGRQGFKMAVAADNIFCGSIGGGIMEHKFVELAKTIVSSEKAYAKLFRQVHDKSEAKDQSGMICSGEQLIFLYLLQEKDLDVIHTIINDLQLNRNGRLELTPAGIRFSDDAPAENFSLSYNHEQDFLFVEKTGYKNVLHIIGGGHCSLAFSRLMRTMDFYIHLYEERSNLNTLDANNYVHEKHIVGSFADIEKMISSGQDVYVVIMTVGYRTDETALLSLRKKNFRYLGVLGSKTKMKKMFETGPLENMSEDFLQKVRTPVGIAIHSQTPEEIAVSIAAEIIAEKNKHQ